MKAQRCKRPDRHAPRLVCGYPLPCPHHTAAMSLRPVAIELPREPISMAALVRLDEVAEVLGSAPRETPEDPA